MPPKASTSAAAAPSSDESVTHWLMKAEPDSRIVKGKDVKFSIDDFEAMGTTPWDGVRNHQAKNFMKEKMKLGHKILFYHSNTKVPGVYGTGEVTKEGYPDPSALDPTHPYYDTKSKPDSPTWYLVNVTFRTRLAFPVTLSLLKTIASSSSTTSIEDLREHLGLGKWFGEEHRGLIATLPLINRGRLSVQPVQSRAAYEVIVRLGGEETRGVVVAKGKKGKGKGKKEEGDEKEGGGETVKAKGKRKEEEMDEEEEGTKEASGSGSGSGRRKSARRS